MKESGFGFEPERSSHENSGNRSETEARTGDWTTWALQPLRFIERLTLKADYINMERQHEEDRWWIRHSDGRLQGPVGFSSVREQLLDEDDAISVIHDSEKEKAGAEWTELYHPTLWSHPVFGRLWIVAFWLVASLAGYCAVQVLLPGEWKLHGGILTALILAVFWSVYLIRRTAGDSEDTASE